jgi:hypothetical protein
MKIYANMKSHSNELTVDEVVNNIVKVYFFFLNIYLLFLTLDKIGSEWNTTLRGRYVFRFFK